jgi:hypothetical protein
MKKKEGRREEGGRTMKREKKKRQRELILLCPILTSEVQTCQIRLKGLKPLDNVESVHQGIVLAQLFQRAV